MKNSLSFNKISAALLIALIIGWIAATISESVVAPQMLEKNVLVVETGAAPVASGAPATAAGPAPIAPLMASANAEAGAKAAKVCAACHSFGKGEASKMGPNLYDIVGAKHAQVASFSYSPALQAMADKTWSYDALNEFLYNPKAAISGTKMTFAGIKNDQDRANVIAWLRTLADSPMALPK